jgi:CRISPR-associated protein Cmr6
MYKSDGVLKIRRSKKNKLICEVDVGGKQPLLVPKFYDINDEGLNGRKCVVFRDFGRIVKIEIEGKELPRKNFEPESISQKSSHQRTQSHFKNLPKINSSSDSADSFSIKNTMLPKYIRQLRLTEIDNFSLKLYKAARFSEEDNKFKFYDVDRGKIIYSIKADFNKINFSKINSNNYQNVKNMGLEIAISQFKPDWRLIVGLGVDSVYEIGITLHHIYGIPYIPGQSVKGALRSYIINEFFGKNEGDDQNGALADPLFCDIFGCPPKSFYSEARQGLIWFFDAFPTSTPKLEVDIMNPHYSDYYSGNGNKPPADYYNPIPIPFLTVGKETQYQFLIGIKKEAQKILKNYDKNKSVLVKTIRTKVSDKKISDTITLLELTQIILEKSLKEFGIGAKTAVGYGYFQ